MAVISLHGADAWRASNRLLAQLRDDDWSLVSPHLEVGEMGTGDTLFAEGEDVGRCYFPCNGMVASLRISDASGAVCEVCTIGQEGAAGGIISHGQAPAFTSAVTAAAGPALSIATSSLKPPND